MKRCRGLLAVVFLLASATGWAQGRVQAVSGKQVTLSVGSDDDVATGQTGTIRQIRGVGNRIVTVEIARFRVTAVRDATSTAEITSLEPGARVGVGNRIAFEPPPAQEPPEPALSEADQPLSPALVTMPGEEPPGAPAGHPVRVGGHVKPPKRTRTVPPVYPDAARAARVQGVVVLECTVSPEGRVAKIVVLRGIPLLDEAAADAVEQWQWEPTIVDGKAVPVVMTVTVNFKLDE